MTTMCQTLLHVLLSNLTFPGNPLEKATLPPIIWMVGARFRGIKFITEIMQLADRAEIPHQCGPKWIRFPHRAAALFTWTPQPGIVVQEGTALHRWKNSLAYRTFFTLNFNLPCHSIRVGRKRSGAGGGVFVSRGTEVPGAITTFVPTLPLLVYNRNATKKRAKFSASLTSNLGK